jgi:hypothetical protein
VRLVFTGHIAGAGTGSGLRIVVGAWADSPFGAFTDVMLQTADDERVLLAPDEAIAEFVSTTYEFDRVEVGELTTDLGADRLTVAGESFDARIGIGGPALRRAAIAAHRHDRRSLPRRAVRRPRTAAATGEFRVLIGACRPADRRGDHDNRRITGGNTVSWWPPIPMRMPAAASTRLNRPPVAAPTTAGSSMPSAHFRITPGRPTRPTT